MPRGTPARKGHWPLGKRRHAESPGWQATREALRQLLACHWRMGVVSMSACALAVGAAGGSRTVMRWLDGSRMPDPAMQAAAGRWVRERLAQIGREGA